MAGENGSVPQQVWQRQALQFHMLLQILPQRVVRVHVQLRRLVLRAEAQRLPSALLQGDGPQVQQDV